MILFLFILIVVRFNNVLKIYEYKVLFLLQNKMHQPQYTQKFRTAWLKDPLLKNWLITVQSTAGTEAKCKFCGKIVTSRYADLKSHGDSKKHKSNATNFLGKSQTKIPFAKESTLEESKTAEARLALFIAKHTSINIVDHLTDLCKNTFKCTASDYIQMHRTKCANIIKNVLAPHFVQQLRNDIGNRPYSILIDESTDITTDKYLGSTILYYSSSKKQIVNSFFDLVELDAGNAESIVAALKNVLAKYKLNIKNLKGIGTDNASVMVGINNGVYTKLKQDIPNLVLIRCVCHSLQLAVSSAAKQHLPRSLEFLISETFNWFSNSTHRQKSYKQFYNLINEGEDPLKITSISATRWLSIESAVSKIYSQWLELKKTHFCIAKDTEKCYTAQILYEMYNDEINYAYLCFLKPVLIDVQRMNKAFEANNVDSSKLLDDLTTLLESLIKKITTPNSQFKLFHDNIESFVDKNCYLGYLFESKLNTMKESGFKDERPLRERCINFLMALVKEISQRLPDNVNILKQVSLFSVENTLRVVKPDLISILENFNYDPPLIDSIQNQWKNITLKKWENTSDTIKFWAEVNEYKDSNRENPYKELSELALSLLVLPHSNAEVERLFSQMNLIKSKLRNRMQLSMLSSILSIRSGLARDNKCCFNYNIPQNVLTKIKTLATYECTSAELEIDFIENILN